MGSLVSDGCMFVEFEFKTELGVWLFSACWFIAVCMCLVIDIFAGVQECVRRVSWSMRWVNLFLLQSWCSYRVVWVIRAAWNWVPSMVRWHCIKSIFFCIWICWVFLVVRQPAVVLSIWFCVVCTFVILYLLLRGWNIRQMRYSLKWSGWIFCIGCWEILFYCPNLVPVL